LMDFATSRSLPGPENALDLGALVRRIATESTEGTKMRVTCSGDWPMMHTAVAPLDLVLRNIVQNAVRHHDKTDGTLNIACRVDGTICMIDIQDDGPGIPAERQDAVFDALVSFATEGTPSSGLGLSFVRRAARSVGGDVKVASNPEKLRGTTFTVTWPFVPQRS